MSNNRHSMAGKTVMVTGATNGIGKATAEALAQMGAVVIVVGRSRERVDATVEGIRAQGGDARTAVADLSRQADVRELATLVQEKYDRLDVLVNNAGAIYDRFQESADGIEMTFALNHLNYFLLTSLLLPLVKDTAAQAGEARIINVSSDAHQMARGGLKFDDLEFRTSYSGWLAYGHSKLANILFTHELAQRLNGTSVTTNALHPGGVATGFSMNNNSPLYALFKLVRPFMKTPEQGAATSIYLASAPEVRGITGKYFADCKQKNPARAALDDAAAHRLWEISEQMTGVRVAV